MCSVLSRNVFRIGRFVHKSSPVFAHKVINISKIKFKKSYSTDDKLEKYPNEEILQQDEEHNLAPDVKLEYKVFRDEDADIIFDVDEEKEKLGLEIINASQVTDPYEGINMKRGINGVFDIKDLVDILRKDKAQDIFVVTVPYELSYVDYIVIVTGKSYRHMNALATYIRKVFKLKKHKGDLLPKIEGEKSKEWIALDLGNIALHIFSSSAREKYDLETLWSLGSKYDKIMNSSNDENFVDRYSEYLAGLQPANNIESSSNTV